VAIYSPQPACEKTGERISPNVSGAPQELLHAWQKEAHPTDGHSDIRTTLDIYAQISDPEVARMVNQVTNRILGLGEEGESGSVQWGGRGELEANGFLLK